jgi:outer membrane protein
MTQPSPSAQSSLKGVGAFVRTAVGGVLAVACASAGASELGDLLRGTLDHPSVAARSEETSAAHQELDAASRQYLGSGGLSAGIVRYEDQRFIGALSPTTLAAPPFDRTSTRYGITYSVPIDLFGAIAASREAARSTLESAQLAERQQILMKLHDATSAYVRLQALQQEEAALTAQRQRVTTTLDRIRQEVKVQLAAGVDLKLAESEVARIRSDEVRLQGSIAEARAALTEAAGQALEVSEHLTRIPDWPSADREDALPLRLARAASAVSQAQADEARRSLLPSVAAVGDYSQFSGTAGVPDMWSVGAMITIPINTSANRRTSALDARARAAARRETAVAGELTMQWTALKAAYDSAAADIAAVREEVSARREVVSVQVELQRVGVTSMEDLLRQQRDLVDSESREAQAQARAITAWSAAHVLLGTEPSAYIALLE